MSVAGILAILLGVMLWPVAMIERSNRRVLVFGLLLILHVCASLFYFRFALEDGADSTAYYYDIFGYAQAPLRPGTVFVVHLTQWLKEGLDATFLDLFFIFQLFGLAGLALLARTFEEVYRELDVSQPHWTFLLLFLPGLHFWTSMIGKDAPLFFGVALAVWGSMHIRRRWIALVAATLIMVAFRPHVALLATAAAAVTVMLDSRTPPGAKVALLVVGLAGVGLTAGTLQSYININIYDPESVGAFLESRNEIGASHENSAFANAPLIMRIFALLFMPFFFGVEDPFGLIASLENAVIMVIICLLVLNARAALTLFRKVAFIRFSLMFSVCLIIMLALVYYNVGLGLRQKTMIMPPLLSIVVAVVAIRRSRRLRPHQGASVHTAPLSTVAAGPHS